MAPMKTLALHTGTTQPGVSSFSIVVGTDGSPASRAAVRATLGFPWPTGSTVHGVVGRRTRATAGRPVYVVGAFDRAFHEIADETRRLLARKWPGAEVSVRDASPADAILREARRVHAGAIVVGWRGHGLFARLLLGSVSRNVVRHAACPVLVVNGRPRRMRRRFVIGLDGSENARRAVSFVARLTPPRGNQVTLVRALETVTQPSRTVLPRTVGPLVANALSDYEAHLAVKAERELHAAAMTLRRAGWRVRRRVVRGAPLATLLSVVRGARADVLVVGGRGVAGLERLLLGSVAEGALNRAPVSVLVVR